MTLMSLRGNFNRTCIAFIVLLCLCVMMQMLGLPFTLWNLSEELDTFENWDFSIPSTIPRWNLSILFTPLDMSQPNLYLPLLLHTIFHPPKSPQ